MSLRKEKIIVLAVAFAISFLLYGNSIKGDFVSDDKLTILQNPLVSGNFPDLFKAFSSPYYHNQPHAGLYRPFTTASYNLNKIFDSGPLGFHLLNIILNAINGFLIFLLVSKLLNKRTAFIAAALFLFLPIHSEAVSAIAGRGELLSFLFSVSSLIFVLNKRYAVASLLLLAGLLSKETAAGFFLVFLYLWKFREHKTLKQTFYNSLYFVPAIMLYAIMRAFVLGKYFIGVDHLMAYNPLKFVPFSHSLWTSLKVFYLYLLKTVAPTRLSSDYSFNQIPVIQNPFLHYEVYIAGTVLAALIYIAIKRRENILGLSVIIFLFTFLQVSNWFIKIGTIMGERLMYAPSLGLAMLAAVIMQNLKLKAQNKILFFALHFSLCALFLWYGYIIIDRNKDWKDEASIITSGYNASPNSVVSLTNMGFLSFNNKNYQETSEWAEKALIILPEHIPSLFLNGQAKKNLGDLRSAEASWNKMIELNPGHVIAYLSLGILYYEQGQLDKAESTLEKGFKLERTWGKAFPLAIVKINLGKYEEAILLIVGNFGTNPDKRELKFALGLAHLKRGDKQKAEFYLNQIKDPNIDIEDYFKQVINQKVFKINEY